MATDPREYFPTTINIGNYIPSLDDIQNSALTLKSTVVDIVKGRNNNSGLAVHTITYMKFEEWTCHNQTHYYLIIGTSTGFQVFLLHDSRDREQKITSTQSSSSNLHKTAQTIDNVSSASNASPIINPLAPLINGSPHHSPSLGAVSSKRKKFHKKALSGSDNLEMIKVAPGGGKQQRQINNPISCAAIVHEPHKWEGPIIAVSPANEAHNFDSKCVRLYSLMEQQYVHVYRLRTRVHGILSRRSALIIVTEKEIVVMNPMTDEKLYRKSCAPNPVSGVIASLGARWLAFADHKLRETQIGTHILPRNMQNGPNNNNYTSSSPLSPSLKKKKKRNKTEDDNDSGNNNNETIRNIEDEYADDFGVFSKLDKYEVGDGRPSGYSLMKSSLYTASDEITKRVSHTMSGTMKFIQDSFVETKKEVTNRVKKQQKNINNNNNVNTDINNSYYYNNSNLYCHEPPSQGIISIIDYISGELLMNFIAHCSAPLMHIAFDPSGTLLVSADRDGIYLHVYQVIGFPMDASINNNNNTANCEVIDGDDNDIDNDIDEPTVYRKLYKIYRGFRYAIIRDITFSLDSKWLAVSSARGTIHIYAINRAGGMPRFATHNVAYCDNIALNDSLCCDIHKMCDLQSIKKLHHEMKETRKDQMGSITSTGGTKIVSTFSFLGNNSLFVQTPIAFHQYNMNWIYSNSNSNSINQKELFLNIEHLDKFSSRDLYNAQSVSYPYLHDQLYPESTPNPMALMNIPSITMSVFNLDESKDNQITNSLSSNSSSTNKKYDEDTKRWINNTELHPINRFNTVSLWGNPQFNFYSFTNTNDDDDDEEEDSNIKPIESVDPYSFLEIKRIHNGIPIKLHQDSPIVGPRINQPQIEVTISDLQSTIDSAMGTVIDQTNNNNNDDDDNNDDNDSNDDDDDEFDRHIPLPSNEGILPTILNEQYADKLDDGDDQNTDSDDFQIVD